MLFLPATNGKYEVGNKVTSAKNHVSTFEFIIVDSSISQGFYFSFRKCTFSIYSICSHKLLHDTTTRVFKNMSHNMTHMTEGILSHSMFVNIHKCVFDTDKSSI
jgi:hypothetical protein